MKIHTDQFEGPLDLLLTMIEDEKLDITEISLAKIADQYIEYIENKTDIDPEEIADFLVVAAKLLLIKSKTLLPYLMRDEDEEEIKDFEKQLKIYKDFLVASKKIEELALAKTFTHSRDMIKFDSEQLFYPPANVSLKILRENFVELIDRLKPQEILAESTIAKSVSMEERISVIKDYLKILEEFSFSKLLEDTNTKIDVIVNFMAVLEMIKGRHINANQKVLFGEIIVNRIN